MSLETTTIKLLKLPENNALPSLVTFPQNIPPVNYLTTENNNKLNDLLQYKKYKNNSSNKTALYAENSKFEYQGKHSNFTTDKKYLLGFMENGQKKQKVVELGNNFAVNQLIKEQGHGGESFGMNTDVDAYEQKKMQVEELGTKKSKSILKKLQGKVIKEEAINSIGEIKQLMKKKGQEIREEQQDETSEKFQQELIKKRKYQPEFNYSAKTASKIYNPKSIITELEWEHLNLSNLNNKKAVHPFINDLLFDKKYTDKNLVGPEAVTKKKQLLYLSYVLSMYRNREISVHLNELAEQLQIPFELVCSIVNKFFEIGESKTDSKRYVRSKNLDLKMSCYILVLALMVQGYRMDQQPLMKWQKMEDKKLTNLAREVGCSVTKSEKGYMAKLTKIVLDQKPMTFKKKK